MKRVCIAVLSAGLLACAPSNEAADTMSLGTIDTVKPAVDSGAPAGATTGAQVTPSSTSAASQTKTGTKTAPRDTTNIGRDSAIQPNTKDPRFRLPVVDTTKRPPSGD